MYDSNMDVTPKILIVDDNPFDRSLVERELLLEFPQAEIRHILDQKIFDNALEERDIDLVITDFQLCWSDGLAILRGIKGKLPECPVVMFTGTGSEEIAVEAMKSGLYDYVLKSPKHFVRLRSISRSSLESASHKREAARLERELRALLDRLDVGVFSASPLGRLLEANPAFLRITGLNSLENAKAAGLSAVFSPADLARFLTKVEESGNLRKEEVKLNLPRSETVWVSVTLTISQTANGPILEGIIEDISSRKNAEEALSRAEEMNQALLELVDEKASFVYYQQDESITLNGKSFARYTPAKILRKIVSDYVQKGRTNFQFMEFKRNIEIAVNRKKPNFEVRLKRLAEKLSVRSSKVRIARTGKGEFALQAECKVEYMEES